MGSVEDKIIRNLSVDCVVFGFNGELKVLLIKHTKGAEKGRWSLPGNYVKKNESLREVAAQTLYSLGTSSAHLEQLKAFGDVNRMPKRVISVAYCGLVKPTVLDRMVAPETTHQQWFKINSVPSMPYDHSKILRFAVSRLRSMVKYEPMGFELLPEKFTLLQLQNLYEKVLDIKLDKPNFRRKILNMKILIDCDEKQDNVSYRAAKLYKLDTSILQSASNTRFILDL